MVVLPRQTGGNNNNNNINNDDYFYYDPWYSPTAFIVKWVIVGVLLLAFITFIVGGYWHAQRRMKKGLAPLRYHRWMISRASRERFFPPAQNNAAYYNQTGQDYPMQPWAAPPPAYGEHGYVPPYPGAPVASKVNPNQNQSYAPPAGPPPAQAATSIRDLEQGQQTGTVASTSGARPHDATVEVSK